MNQSFDERIGYDMLDPCNHNIIVYFYWKVTDVLVIFLSLCSASDDIQRADEVRALVKDIWDLRLAKLRKSIDLMVTQQEIFGKVRTTSTQG